jgi:Zinc knuckle
MRKKREGILRDIIEQEVEKRMEKLKRKPTVTGRSSFNEHCRNYKRNQAVEEEKCYRCGKLGHIKKGCREKLEYKVKVKRNKEDQVYSCILLEQLGEQKSKRTKLNLTSLMHEFSDVIHSARLNEKIKFCEIEKCRIDTPTGKIIVKRGAIISLEIICINDGV